MGILEAGTRFAFVKAPHKTAHIGGNVRTLQYYKLADGTGWAINNDVGFFRKGNMWAHSLLGI